MPGMAETAAPAVSVFTNCLREVVVGWSEFIGVEGSGLELVGKVVVFVGDASVLASITPSSITGYYSRCAANISDNEGKISW
jgi:hypothetical protein